MTHDRDHSVGRDPGESQSRRPRAVPVMSICFPAGWEERGCGQHSPSDQDPAVSVGCAPPNLKALNRQRWERRVTMISSAGRGLPRRKQCIRIPTV